MTPPPTIKQRRRAVIVEQDGVTREVKVRRFYWGAARDFAKTLVGYVAELFGAKAAVSLEMKPEDFVAIAIPLILSSDQLVKELLTSTSDLTAEQIDHLETVDVLALVRGALEINFDEETKNSFAGVASILLSAAGNPKTTSGAASTPTSSTPATPPTTSTAAPSSTSTSSAAKSTS